MQKKFLRTFAMTGVCLTGLSLCSLNLSKALDPEEFITSVTPILQAATCHGKKIYELQQEGSRISMIATNGRGNVVFCRSIVERGVPYTPVWTGGYRCRNCNRDMPLQDKIPKIPEIILGTNGCYQTMKLNERQWAYLNYCPKAKIDPELRAKMPHNIQPIGPDPKLWTTLLVLWRANRPPNIKHRLEHVTCLVGSNGIDEHTPLCTPECDVLMFQRIIDPPRKTTSCCCSLL